MTNLCASSDIMRFPIIFTACLAGSAFARAIQRSTGQGDDDDDNDITKSSSISHSQGISDEIIKFAHKITGGKSINVDLGKEIDVDQLKQLLQPASLLHPGALGRLFDNGNVFKGLPKKPITTTYS